MSKGLIPIPVLLSVLAAAAGASAPPEQPGASGRIFTHRQAEKARQLARDECKPLVVHFVPDTTVGVEQLESFYAEPGGVDDQLLRSVVIVVVPTERYRRFAEQLGVSGAGGYRTISAYDLSVFDEQSVETCRSGFK